MRKNPMRSRMTCLVLAGALLGGCAATTTTPAPVPAAAVGRVLLIDAFAGTIRADFGGRETVITLDKRELGAYAPGDEIRIDSFGRPLPSR
jgi:hypothetical protein